LTQSVSLAVGLQERFDWRGMAASAAGAAAGQATAGALSEPLAHALQNDTGAKLVTGTLAGLASGATAAVLRGGRFSVQQVAVDAFGNALGQGLVDSMQPTQGEGPWSSADYRNGSDIESDNAYYDRMTQQALQRGGQGLSDSATNAEVMAYRMREAGFDGDMVPTGGATPAGPGLTVRPRPLAFKQLPQLNEETGLMGFDQGNGVWSYPVPVRPTIETRPLGSAAGSESLPPVENLYTPLEGFFEGRYRMAVQGMTDPNASLLDQGVNLLLGMGVAPLAALEAPVTGLYNATNNAWRAGQNLARADLTSDTDVAVMSRLEATAELAGAFLGLGGPAAVMQPRPSLGAPGVRTSAIADDMLAEGELLSNRASGVNELASRPNATFLNRFPKDAIELRSVPSLTQEQVLRMPKNVLYVVKEDGSLVIAPKPADFSYGHVDLARGQNVLAAGEGKVLWGEVKYIDNASGHYLPQGSSAESAAVKAFGDYGFKVPEGAYVNKVYDFKLGRWVKQ